MKKSVYVCHTYYHVYISLLKEFAKPKEEQGGASIVLSLMSTDFENLKERLEAIDYLENVYVYDEKSEDRFEDLAKYRKPSSNFVSGLLNRIKFTKKLGKYQEQYIPVDFKTFDEVYVFCDSDPIGYYLNYKHVYYHAVEDGLDTLKSSDLARVDNTPHFGLKTFLSKKLNLIFVQNGYGRYCRDMEVNNTSILKYPCKYRFEVPRDALYQRLTDDEKNLLLRVFVKNKEKLEEVIKENNQKTVVLLTEPLCALDVRKQIFTDMKEKYEGEGYQVIFKQHPRDLLDYEKEFPDTLLIDRTVPMEILNFYRDNRFELVVSVFTELSNVYFAENKLRLGRDFMDKYEDRAAHESRFESK